jgi:catalase-peroxidase
MEHIRLAPQKDWEVNNPVQLKKVLEVFDHIQAEFNKAQSDDKKVSIADLIVLGGCAAIEKQQKAGHHDCLYSWTG